MNRERAIAQKASLRLERAKGFTLFELVSYILVVAITASVAYNRFAEFPEAAERANFLAITVQLRTGVNLQMMNGIARGGWLELKDLEGSNPMDLMLERPSNYVGELTSYDAETMERRVWYFDPDAGELVYVANNADTLYRIEGDQQIPTQTVRFRIKMKFRGQSTRNWEGLVMEPTAAYVWESMDLRLPEAFVQ
ncbi:MAG: hypothetical protein R3332_10035 [Pseudohongiellaceae bacterium]|nr:hypothetical protein [Pseudohongiellaceae bacterium]